LAERIHLIGICGTAMATLAALLKRRGFDVRGSDQNVYPPMSDFLAAEGIPAASGYAADTSPAMSISWSSATPFRAAIRSSRRSSNGSCATVRCRKPFVTVSLGRALDGPRRHARQDHDDVADRMAADAWRRRSDDARRWHRAQFRRRRSSYRVGAGREFVIEGDEYDSAFFDKTAKFLKYLPDVAVINNIEFDHADIYATSMPSCSPSAAGQPGAAQRPAAARRRQSACGGVARSGGEPGRDVRLDERQHLAGHGCRMRTAARVSR
jgi:UDP-N-acetylmuramate: L-alanyl-gamma-D-glutamyl-meso-diaminopimelate ligase